MPLLFCITWNPQSLDFLSNVSSLVTVFSAATGLQANKLNRNAPREDREAWIFAASSASAAQKAKNNRALWACDTTPQKLQDCRQSGELSCLASHNNSSTVSKTWGFDRIFASPLTLRRVEAGNKSTLPPSLTPFMVTELHQWNGRLLDRSI